MTNIELYTSLNTLEKLYDLAESSAKRVSIDPQILKQLLMDHSTMFRIITEDGRFKVKEPRYREKL